MRRLVVLLFLPCLSACFDAEDETVNEPQHTAVASIVSGTVRGTDNTSICNSLSPGTQWTVEIIDTSPNPDVAVVSDVVTCPTNTYSISVPEGTDYLIRLESNVPAGPVPRVYHDPVRLDVSGPTTRDVRVRGRQLLGYTLLNGAPAANFWTEIQQDQTDVEGRFAGYGYSDADGRWDVFLQPGVTYQLFCGLQLGLRTVTPPIPFLFPYDKERFDCAYRTAAAEEWTHRATQLVMTPWPGNFDYRYPHPGGNGWGVQYPVTGEPSYTYQQLYGGGLFVSAGPEIVSSFDSGWLCSTCGTISPATQNPWVGSDGPRKRVRWVLGPSPDSEGLHVTQTSYDGTGGDYVLYHLKITNNGASGFRTYVGAFYDWDIGFDIGNNTGGTALGGRIAYVTGDGVFFGSIFLGDQLTRSTWFRNGTIPANEAELLDILNGTTQMTSASPQDVSLIQSAGSATIFPGRSKNLWFAIVAGNSVAELEANANAAAADFTARTGMAGY